MYDTDGFCGRCENLRNHRGLKCSSLSSHGDGITSIKTRISHVEAKYATNDEVIL